MAKKEGETIEFEAKTLVGELPELEVYPEPVEQTDGVAEGTGPGYVYILQEQVPPTTFYVIGSSRDPSQERSNLQKGNPRPLYFYGRPPTHVFAVTNMKDAEAAARSANMQYSVDLGGGTEWFQVPLKSLQSFYSDVTKAVASYALRSSA